MKRTRNQIISIYLHFISGQEIKYDEIYEVTEISKGGYFG